MVKIHNLLLFFCLPWTALFCADDLGTQTLLKIKKTQAIRKNIEGILQKNTTAQKPSDSTLSQTQAYLKVKDGLVKKKWNKELKTYQKIIDDVLAQESTYKDSYYVFYHSQRSQFRILHDFIKELYQVFALMPDLTEFHFLRVWYDTVDSADVKAFLEKYKWHLGSGWTHDDSRRMLCANLSLFGNSNNSWECSFSYFVRNFNIFPSPIKDYLNDIFDRFGLNKKFIPELMKLGETVSSDQGILYQIFIPKEKVDKYVYLANVGSAPWNSVIVESCFDYVNWHHTLISPILEKYCSDPAKIYSIDEIQARILISKDLLLNPLSGVKIFRFSAIDEKAEQVYLQQLNTLVTKIMHNLFADKKNYKKLMANPVIKNMSIMGILKDTKLV